MARFTGALTRRAPVSRAPASTALTSTAPTSTGPSSRTSTRGAPTAGRLAALGGAVAGALVAASTPAVAAESAPRGRPDCAAVGARVDAGVDGRLLAALGLAGLLDAEVLRPPAVP